MSLRSRVLVVGAAALMLAACQTPTTYHPATEPGGTGYTDQQLAANRYRVTFTGNSATPRVTVENYLLMRAAEVTLKAGYRWFTFDTRSTEAQTTYQSDFMGWPGWGGYGWYWHSWPYGPGWNRDLTSQPITKYEAYAEIIMLTDAQAKDEPRALNAQDVLNHVGAGVAPPSQSP